MSRRNFPRRDPVRNEKTTTTTLEGMSTSAPHEPLLRGTAVVKNIIAAIKLQGGGYRTPNFIQSDNALRILKRDSLDTPFAQMEYIAFLLGLRVPSEALLLRMGIQDRRPNELRTVQRFRLYCYFR